MPIDPSQYKCMGLSSRQCPTITGCVWNKSVKRCGPIFKGVNPLMRAKMAAARRARKPAKRAVAKRTVIVSRWGAAVSPARKTVAKRAVAKRPVGRPRKVGRPKKAVVARRVVAKRPVGRPRKRFIKPGVRLIAGPLGCRTWGAKKGCVKASGCSWARISRKFPLACYSKTTLAEARRRLGTGAFVARKTYKPRAKVVAKARVVGKRVTNPWIRHLTSFRRSHPGMSVPEAAKKAKLTYKKKGVVKRRVVKRKVVKKRSMGMKRKSMAMKK